MKSYSDILGMTAEARAQNLRTLSTESGSRQMEAAKILVAMERAGDIGDGKLRDYASKALGIDIRDGLQGTYEVAVVFRAVLDREIDMTEEDFDKASPSKLGLLSPFVQKDELKDKLVEAVEMVKGDKPASEIRGLKPRKAKADKAKSEAAPAEAKIPVAFAVLDIAPGEPVLTSNALRNRIKEDLIAACNSGAQEVLEYHADKLGRMFFAACKLAEVDPLDILSQLSDELAKQATPIAAAAA